MPAPEDTPEKLAVMLLECARTWQRDLREVSTKGVDGAPDWYGFEDRLWELGESIRQVLSKKRKWRQSEQLLEAFAEILRDARLGKGRQPFAELLARGGGSVYRDELIAAVDDRDIAGHAVRALRIAKIAGAESNVQRLLARKPPTWIKHEAKKYLQLFAE
jgi:hypothetical protein